MERDIDLFRHTLIAVGNHPQPNGWAEINIAGASDMGVSYHVKLLHQAGLFEADDVSVGGASGFSRPFSFQMETQFTYLAGA